MARGFRKFLRQARHSIRKAAPILNAASSVASFVPGVGTAVAAGLGAAGAAASGRPLGSVLGSALGNAIPGGGVARSAIQAAQILGSARGMRAMRAPDPGRSIRRLPALRSATRSTETLAREILRRNPALVAGSANEIARRTGLTERAVANVLRQGAPLAWRPLSRRASGLIGQLSSVSPFHFSRDVAGLSADGLTYVVEAGDYPGKIAAKLTGDASRYPELYAANPQKPTVLVKGVRNFKTLYAGEKLTLPASWVKPTAAPALSSATTLKSKAILAAWSKTDGLNASGVSDYGLRPEDATATWTDRDRLELKSFEFQQRMSDQSGALTQIAADALDAWAESKAAQVSPLPAVTPAVVVPTDVITAPRPTGPVMMPNDVPPPLGNPNPTIPALPAPSTLPALPAPTTTATRAPVPVTTSDGPILLPPDDVLNDTAPPPAGGGGGGEGDPSTVLALAGLAAAALFFL